MSDKTYNGWTNYATWRVNLEIIGDNEEYYNEMIEEMKGDDDDDILYALKDQLIVCVDECLDAHDTNCHGLVRMYADAFVANVNYHEIAKHLLDSYKIEQAHQNEAT
jgi:hypothetical protein|tara:strand:+ start:947 stop:1267 length:321 start_codon:yes stop_codon:yes gene_type:complete